MPNKQRKTTRIAIDGNEANVNHRVGSNVYAYELLVAMEKNTRGKSDLSCTVLLAAPPLADLPPERSGWHYRVVGPRPLWTQIGLPIHLFLHKHDYDVFYTPGHYAPRLSAVPYVSSVMDLGFLYFPEQFKKKDYAQLKDWTAYSVKRASKVIAISQATKNDVVATYGRSAKDVVVAYPSISSEQTPASELELREFLEVKGIEQPFILYVGTLQPRKNLVRLIKAFEEVCSRRNLQQVRKKVKAKGQVQLVIAGKVGWLADEVTEAIEASPFKSQIITAGYISDPIKYALYKAASCSVLVGLYEGFGIPPLESLAAGTVPVVSDTTSLPEVVGKAGILVDPYDEQNIAEGLLTALSLSAKQRGQYRAQARTQLAKFSWEKSAEVVLGTLLKVLQQKS